jgi:hypothetical protein
MNKKKMLEWHTATDASGKLPEMKSGKGNCQQMGRVERSKQGEVKLRTGIYESHREKRAGNKSGETQAKVKGANLPPKGATEHQIEQMVATHNSHRSEKKRHPNHHETQIKRLPARTPRNQIKDGATR